MTTLDDTRLWVSQHPFDQVAALAFADRLQEERNLSRYRALWWAARARRPGRQAHYLAEAAAVMRRKSRAALIARDMVITHATTWGNDATTVIFLSGFRSPKTAVPATALPERFPPGIMVSVGAREFLRLYHLCVRSIRDARKHRPRILKTKKAGGK